MQPSPVSVRTSTRRDNLENNEDRLQTFIDTMPGLVWSALPDGDVEFCNQRWLAYTGMSFDEIKGRGWIAAIHPQDVTEKNECDKRDRKEPSKPVPDIEDCAKA